MKKILALAAVAALTAGVSAYAANPFSDVSTDHWAYQAVADLSAQGVVEGYPNGTFQGEKHITRYEAAQIVARLLAQESQLNAQQKATVEKLAAEYADELNNLGVRVSNLENKVGNVTWGGDARIKFERDDSKADKDSYEARLRLNLKAQANDKVAVKARLATKFDLKDGGDMAVKAERLHAEYAPVEGLTLDLGRTDATLGAGLFYDDTFDGVVASYAIKDVNLQAGYGRYKEFSFDDTAKREAVFVQGSTKIADKVNVGAFYTRLEKKANENDRVAFYGVNAKVDLMAGLSVDGEYVRLADKVKVYNDELLQDMWSAGFEYAYGPATLGVHYYDVDAGANLGGSTAAYFYDNAKFWVASGEVALAKDVTLKADYAFNGEEKDLAKTKIDKAWNISLNYVF